MLLLVAEGRVFDDGMNTGGAHLFGGAGDSSWRRRAMAGSGRSRLASLASCDHFFLAVVKRDGSIQFDSVRCGGDERVYYCSRCLAGPGYILIGTATHDTCLSCVFRLKREHVWIS